MRRAVVFGSGGITGGAWEIGVLKGLQDHGIDLTSADLFVGSSVGASIATMLRAGKTASDVLEWRLQPPAPRPERSAAEVEYFQKCSRLWGAARRDQAARLELGRLALSTPNPIPESVQLSNMRVRFGLDAWPAGDLRLVAVDVSDGSVRYFDAQKDVPLEAALAASSAQPGLQAPVTIDGRRYMDGGIAGTGIAGAEGCGVILGITAFPGRSIAEEIADVTALGSRVLDLAPDSEAREAMGSNIADFLLARPAADAGIRQAAGFAEQVRRFWAAE